MLIYLKNNLDKFQPNPIWNAGGALEGRPNSISNSNNNNNNNNNTSSEIGSVRGLKMKTRLTKVQKIEDKRLSR